MRAWDRTASRAAALVKDGATVAASPAEAVKGAGILITMLADGPATEQAWRGPDGLLAAGPGLIWVQMATVGLEWTERFANTAARYGVSFFDAPVSGSQGPAQAGELTILASGPAWMPEAVAPVFAALGRATAWLGPAGNGTRAELVLNNWLADLTESTAETLAFARGLGLDPAAIVDLLESTPLGSPYAVQKARAMLAGTSPPRSRSSTRSKTPISPRRPRGPAAPSSPSPARCCRGGVGRGQRARRRRPGRHLHHTLTPPSPKDVGPDRRRPNHPGCGADQRWIEATGKNLTTIYITHGHGDHIGLNGIDLWSAFTDRWPCSDSAQELVDKTMAVTAISTTPAPCGRAAQAVFEQSQGAS